MLPPLTIVEVVVLDFNLNFRVTRGEFAQKQEGVDNTMIPFTEDAESLHPCVNFQARLI